MTDFESITPESAGIPSSAVAAFADTLEQRKIPMHSFMMLRGGKIFAEGYYAPMTADRRHRMYSTTKSFVSIGIGILAGDGKLTLTDHPADYFPEYVPENCHPYVREMTIRDLLMMATPYSYNTYGEHDKNWVKTFFEAKPSYPAGTIFSYNTSATVVLTAIIERLSGMSFIGFMRERVFDKLGMSENIECVERPEGGAWGGSGLLCTPRDLARFALMLSRGGSWNGEQIVPEWYVREATSKQIDNSAVESDPEHAAGYGYQIWQCSHGGFMTLGMGGQVSLCLPKYDFILVTTGDAQYIVNGYSEIFHALWHTVYPALERSGEDAAALPENEAESDALSKKLSELSLLRPDGLYCGGHAYISPAEAEIDGRTFVMNTNPMKISEMSFHFYGWRGVWSYKNASGAHSIEFGMGSYIRGEFPERYYGRRIGILDDRGYDDAACGIWADERTLRLNVCIIDDYFGTMRASFTFMRDGRIAVFMSKTAEWFLNEYQGSGEGHIV